MHSICPRFSDVTGDHAVSAVPHKWGESPSPPKAFQYLCPVILAHISSLYDGALKSGVRRGRAQGCARGGELGQYFYKCPSENGQCWIPCSLVVASVPQILRCMSTVRCRDLLHTNHTGLIFQQTAVCLQHMSNLYIIWFKGEKKKKSFVECLCMNLNFKLFLFFLIQSTDLF